MDLTQTRTSLHGIAELLLAGPQYAAGGGIRLRVLTNGIATTADPDLRLERTELVSARGRFPLVGTYAEVARAVGITPRELDDVYRDRAPVTVEDRIELDADDLAVLVEALALGEAALRELAPDQQPVLWPEHLDVAISVGEVNYGVSPGDAAHREPYAYVGPWQPRTGPFWNEPFGATRPMAELGGHEELLAFFREGADRAAADPVAVENER
ncbi:hypothetical protein JCM18899A_21570 [Nocardioides sp. AN3]